MSKYYRGMCGKKHTEKTKILMSNKLKLRMNTKEAKEKLSKFWKGRKHTEKAKLKMKQAKANIKQETLIKLSKANIGIKNHNWNGGISSINKRIRVSTKYKQWRQEIFIRDNFTCQKCGQIGGYLEAHHKKELNVLIQEAKKYLPLFEIFEAAMLYSPMWDLENGIIYCNKCHKLFKI